VNIRLVGPRFVLRTATVRDVPAIVRYYRANRAFHGPTSPARPAAFFTEAYWRRQVRRHAADLRADRALRFFIFDGDGAVLGSVNFNNFVRGAFQACHLGYALDRRAQGRGIMTEALRLAIAHVFGPMRFHRVMANHLPTNRRSARVLARLGFRVEGRAREYLLIRGRWRDHVLTSLVNPRWR
jgi:ribosomal-protein-alanine N-acetyltransferase